MAGPQYVTKQGDQIYNDGEVLADLVGNGASQDLLFGSAMQLIVLRARGGDARVQPFASGPDPSAAFGWFCPQDEPVYFIVENPKGGPSKLRVFAGAAVTVHSIGYRYA